MNFFKRSDRLKELFLKEISLALPQVKDPGISGLLTVTGLELSKDMKTAFVFFSVLGREEERKNTLDGLNRARHFIRHMLKQRLSIKRLPEIVFKYDPTPEKASRIETLLERIRSEKPEK